MVSQTILTSLLLGAGAGLVAAHPASGWSLKTRGHHVHRSTAFSHAKLPRDYYPTSNPPATQELGVKPQLNANEELDANQKLNENEELDANQQLDANQHLNANQQFDANEDPNGVLTSLRKSSHKSGHSGSKKSSHHYGNSGSSQSTHNPVFTEAGHSSHNSGSSQTGHSSHNSGYQQTGQSSHNSGSSQTGKSNNSGSSGTGGKSSNNSGSPGSGDPDGGSGGSGGSGSSVSTNSCTFTDYRTAIASKNKCSSIVLRNIAVPGGVTLDMTNLNDGTTVTFEGKTTFGFKQWEGPMISFSGNRITIAGAPGHVLDGNGAKWWDGEGANGGSAKPSFFWAHYLTDSIIQDLNIQNYPEQCMSIDGCKNLRIKHLTIDNSAAGDLGHNDDAFVVGYSTGVHISGARVTNKDDCLAIKCGSDITFTDGECLQGHGLSVGSVGALGDNKVSNVHISNSVVSDSQFGVRIKTIAGATGSVSNVTFTDIILHRISQYAVVIEQDYLNKGTTGRPTAGVPITDITVRNVRGDVGQFGHGVWIMCAACHRWSWSGVEISGGRDVNGCTGVPQGVEC